MTESLTWAGVCFESKGTIINRWKYILFPFFLLPTDLHLKLPSVKRVPFCVLSSLIHGSSRFSVFSILCLPFFFCAIWDMKSNGSAETTRLWLSDTCMRSLGNSSGKRSPGKHIHIRPNVWHCGTFFFFLNSICESFPFNFLCFSWVSTQLCHGNATIILSRIKAPFGWCMWLPLRTVGRNNIIWWECERIKRTGE